MKMTSKFLTVGFLVTALFLGGLDPAFATALSAGRNTPQRTGEKTSLTMASNVIIYAGAMVCVNSSGLANPAADTSGFAVIGCAVGTVDNRTAVYQATKKIEIVRGVFRWANADNIAAADIGKICYVTDDATVNKTGGGQNIIAGAIVDVETAGVWVDTGKIGSIGASTPSSLAVNGAATIGTTLSVSGNSTLGGTTVAVTNNETVGGTLDVTGISTLTGGATMPGTAKLTTTPVASANATNGQPVSLSGLVNLLNGTGSAENGTNTITLANPSAAGVWAVIVNVDTATNLLAVAKTGNYHGPALELAPGESAILWAQSTSKWHGIGE